MSSSLIADAPEYPEHEKLAAVSDDSQTVGEFLDTCGFTLCRVVPKGNNGEPRFIDEDGKPTDTGGMSRDWNPAYESWNDHYSPVGSIEAVLADYFGIDRAALEREKRAMLEAIRHGK